MESSEWASFWSKPGEEGGEENKTNKLNNHCQLQKNYLAKEKKWHEWKPHPHKNTQILHVRDKIREAIAQCHKLKRKLFQSPLQPTQALSENTHTHTHTSEEELQVLNRRRPKNEVSKKIPSHRGIIQRCMYQVQVLKTRGRL